MTLIPTEQELRTFVGRNADYYLRKWAPLLAGQAGGAGFNFAACFLAGLWLPYRKMYKATFIVYGIVLVEFILGDILIGEVLHYQGAALALSNSFRLVLVLLCGAEGNKWYYSHACKAIAATRHQDISEQFWDAAVAPRGGTSLGASLGLFGLFLGLQFAIVIVWAVLGVHLSGAYPSSMAEERARDPLANSVWQSKFHPIHLAYSQRWTKTASFVDSEQQVSMGLIDKSDGKSYQLLVETGIPQEQHTGEEYYDMVKQEMLGADEANELIDETDLRFHGAIYHRLRFRMRTKRWGPLCVHVYARRTGDQLIVVHWAFPYDPHRRDQDKIPEELKQLDANVRFFEDSGRASSNPVRPRS